MARPGTGSQGKDRGTGAIFSSVVEVIGIHYVGPQLGERFLLLCRASRSSPSVWRCRDHVAQSSILSPGTRAKIATIAGHYGCSNFLGNRRDPQIVVLHVRAMWRSLTTDASSLVNSHETSETETEYDMGEIRVKVLLTNSVDETLYLEETNKGSQEQRPMPCSNLRGVNIPEPVRRLSASCLAATGSPNMPMGGPRLLP